MISQSQYDLLAQAKEPIELDSPLPAEWEAVKQYIYLVDEYPVYTSHGVKFVPWHWALNEEGLFEVEQFEKKHSEQKANHTADKGCQNFKTKILKIFLEILIAVVAGVILLFIGKFL